MQIATPIIHLELNSSTYYIHVITWFDSTRFVADGIGTLPATATDDKFVVTLYVDENSSVPDMQLLTPVVHTLELTGISLNAMVPFVEVEVYNNANSSLVGKRKVHRDTASTSAMPDPGPKP